ncbi:MAG: chaperone modulator CbpM [Mucilaginibacter sp.]|uniref:chaperone modulator CbpM n=1 Tax=Mucilaginibacter sp. TaxID=1882438 RepID=UPI00319F4820
MKTADLISTSDFCLFHNVEINFVEMLQEADLIKITIINKNAFIPTTELQKLEKLINLYQLGINVEGLEAISHLLDRFEKTQEDLRHLRNKLSLYEDD